ncbi:MAG: FHA domain-containing protein [Planctomycetales bacterium]|nr:FHA domain-containing protein [Planctomycetales bacterium]
MAEVTLRIIDGADRGRVYSELSTPVTVGREEGNDIQLNDERVSRYHLKIQEDHDKLVLTDLQSTNGTKVNGEEIQLRILRHGDLIAVGRSMLIYGRPEQIAERLARLRGALGKTGSGVSAGSHSSFSLDHELSLCDDSDVQATLHTLDTPELPERMSPGQAAQLSELLEYLHIRIRQLLSTVACDDQQEAVELDQRQWQNLLDLQGKLAEYLRGIGNPESDLD